MLEENKKQFKAKNKQGGKETNQSNFDNDWNFDAWQNWIAFWNLLLQEDRKNNPDSYKEYNNKKIKNENKKYEQR